MEEEFLILPIDICRICSKLQPNLIILTQPLEDEHILLHEALEFVSCLKVDFDDGMSQTMCQACSKSLLEAYRFKNQILDSYRTFYNQTSIVNIKKEGSIDIDITLTEEHNSKDLPEPALVIERLDELDVDLTTDAVSFLVEHHNLKTKAKEPLLIEGRRRQENDPPPKELDLVENNNLSPIPKVESLIKELTPPDRTNTICYDKSKTLKSKFTCHICQKILPKRSNLQDHLRLHANVKNFVCSFCQKAFVQVANYRTHLRVHTKERPYHCHLCPKTYTQAGSLKTHIRSHTNERNYVCDVCNKAFTNSSDLSKHERIHDQSRQFKCEYCGHLFSQRANLRVHKFNIHSKGNPYSIKKMVIK